MLEKIALQKKLISEKNAQDAANACRASENFEEALKDYFLTHDLISPKTLERLINTIDAIKIVKKNIKFATIAMEMGFISKETLEAAFDHQKKVVAENQQPRLIGHILYDSGKLTEEQLQMVIEEQNKQNLKVEVIKKEDFPKPKINKIPKKEPEYDSDSDSDSDSDAEPEFESKGKAEGHDISETIRGGMILDIEDNGLSAFLRKTEEFNDTQSADDIYNLLLSRNIQYGVESTKAIEGFISSRGFKKKRFKVASGTPEIIGSNARIEYYFNTDHLLVGKIDEEGNIDLMERGEIPRVEAKTLLAEKFPHIESKSGRDVFGKELLVEPAMDIPLKIKTGVILSEDGMRVYSEISGHPRLSWSGNISVIDTFLLDGDVSYKTGNLIYNGNIDIQGGLKSGFRVNGVGIRINEVDGGEIHAQGDVTIKNGLNDAVIYSRGHVSAKYVYNSKIYCLGNVYVEREIGDSEIESSGSCWNVTGAIINSTISFNQGVQAKNIGAEKSTPSTIIVGRDQFILNELENIEIGIKVFEKNRLDLWKKKEKRLLDNKGLHQSTTQMASELEKIMVDRQEIEKNFALFSTQPGKKKEARQLKIDLKQKESLFVRLDKELNDRLNFIEKNESELIKIDHAFDDIEIRIDDLRQEKVNFMEWIKSNPGKPIVIASGKVFPGTVVQGVHAQKEIIDTIGNVQINEVLLQINDIDSNIYEIQINDNRSRR